MNTSISVCIFHLLTFDQGMNYALVFDDDKDCASELFTRASFRKTKRSLATK